MKPNSLLAHRAMQILKKGVVPATLGFLLAAIAACVQASPPTLESGPAPVRSAAPASAWEQRWTTTLAAAKKEGSVTVYGVWGVGQRKAVGDAFREKFGIQIEFVLFGKTAEMIARMQAEKRAGLNLTDLTTTGATTPLVNKPTGLFGSVRPLLFLPEVLDPKMWKGEQVPFLDKDGFAIATVASAERYIIYNTDLIKKGEISSYKDILKPQYKGKIAMDDPRVSGSGNSFFSHLALNLWNIEEASEFLRHLVKEQEVQFFRDHRQLGESVARGKNSIGLSVRPETVVEFMELGAPVGHPSLSENATDLSTGNGVLGVSSKPPHPDATTIFFNWLLSKEGHAVFVKGSKVPGLRADAPTEGINPLFFSGRGERLFLASEEQLMLKGEKMPEVARQVIAEAEKG